MEWAKDTYNSQYDSWVPWLEDVYLRWFTKDNKVSYTTRENLDKTKVTGVEQIDTLQDGVNNLAASQLGQGGLLQPISDAVSKEGVNRAERQGRDEKGNYAPGVEASSSSNIPGAETAKNTLSTAADGGKSVVSGAAGGLQSLGGVFGGKKEVSAEEKQQQQQQ